jgi:hypothetical protein
MVQSSQVPNGQINLNPHWLIYSSSAPVSKENQKTCLLLIHFLSANNSLSISLCLVSQIQPFCFNSMANQTVKFSTPTKSMNPNSISKVRVIVRVRPFLPHEIAGKFGDQKPCVSVLDQECDSMEEVAVYLKDKDTR